MRCKGTVISAAVPVYLLTEDLVFPDPNEADEHGLLAVGGDLRPDRILLAYESGVFPWYSDDQPLLWWSPDPRCVLFTSEVKISKSMRTVLNKGAFEVRVDTAFGEVIRSCQQIDRGGEGTWLNNEMIAAYEALHVLGIAHSVEAWNGEELVGGLYGLSLGAMFFGESMFSKQSNASKVALIALCQGARQWGMELIDCQVDNPHLQSMGARTIPRTEFLEHLHRALEADTKRGPWSQRFPTPQNPIN